MPEFKHSSFASVLISHAQTLLHLVHVYQLVGAKVSAQNVEWEKFLL